MKRWRELKAWWATQVAHGADLQPEAGHKAPPSVLGGLLATDFLPAVLEVQQTPPSPLGRGVLWALIALIVIALAWSLFPIEITAVAQGKIIPNGQVKVIQPYETGIVRVINVSEGQVVKAGDILIELDPAVSQADLSRLESELQQAHADSARFRQQGARKSTLSDVGIGADLLDRQKILLASQDAEHRAKVAALDSEIARGLATVATSSNIVRKLEQTLPLITERVEKYARVLESGHVPRVEYLALEEQRIGQEQDLAAERNRRVQASALVAQARAQKAQLIAEYQRTAFEQLNQQEQRITELEQDAVKARQRIGWQKLVSPVDGVVQQIKVHTLGGVVTPAQELLTVVPEGRQVEIEAYLPNKDIGFVSPGLAARIKVETFPFTRYGTLNARIVDVSDDAVSIENVGLVYTIRAVLDTDHIRVDGKSVRLTPGMAVTAEVNTGKRRIIEYFLSPVMRYKDESIKER